MLDKREKEQNTEFYEEARKYFEEKYDNDEWSVAPIIDHESRDNEMGELLTKLDIESNVLTEVEKSYKISRIMQYNANSIALLKI